MNSIYIQGLMEDIAKKDAEIAGLTEKLANARRIAGDNFKEYEKLLGKLNDAEKYATAQTDVIGELKAKRLTRDEIIDILETIELETQGENFSLPYAVGFNRCCIEQLADAIMSAVEGK